MFEPRPEPVADATVWPRDPTLPIGRALFGIRWVRFFQWGNTMIIGYCRISTLEPVARLEEQQRNLAAMGAQEFFSEKIGIIGKTPELERAIESAQKGDVIAITKPYRVARSTRGVLALIDRLGRKGVGFRILDTPLDTSTATGRMILGSVPVWSLGVSPLRSVLWDLSFGWMRLGRRL